MANGGLFFLNYFSYGGCFFEIAFFDTKSYYELTKTILIPTGFAVR